jgi:predicted TIM-barrel fold metal-dependent hydrolase
MLARPDMTQELKLNVRDSWPRLEPKALQESAETNGVDLCVLLPTAPPEKASTVNDRFMSYAERFTRIRSLATLHPFMKDMSREIQRVFNAGINGFKFSSFSQRFDVSSLEAAAMFSEVERLGRNRNLPPVMTLDTFAAGHRYFGANPDHLTTPSKLAELARRYTGLNFIAAHMGGLLADFDDLRRSLVPTSNLYLDTSNATHTLREDQFVELLRIHGASHVLFGTDWPWFTHESEIPKLASLLHKAGYNSSECAAVFGGNALALMNL